MRPQLAIYCIGMQETCSKAISMLEARQGGAGHWNLCGKLGFERDENCCSHEPKLVYESTNNKLLWDF